MKTVKKRVFMGWVNTKPAHPEDCYKSSNVSCSPGETWVRVYCYLDDKSIPGHALSECYHCQGLMTEAQRYLCGCAHCIKDSKP